MDRFIVVINKCAIECMRPLKSNMDRFIGFCVYYPIIICNALKSNMDRFIEKQIPLEHLFYRL